MSLLKEKLELKIEEAEFKAEQTASRIPAWAKWPMVVGIAAILPAYFLTKYISLKAWEAKYRTQVITAQPSFTEAKALKTGSVSVFSVDGGNYGAVAPVTNENLELSLQETSYRLHFYNSKSEEIYVANGSFTLLPGQTKYLVIPKILGGEKPDNVKLELPEKLAWQKRYLLPDVTLKTSSVEIYMQNDPRALVAEGNFQNQSPYQLGKVSLTFLILDSQDNIIGASKRDEFTVLPYERRSYKQLWPNFYPGSTAKARIFADTDLLDYSNFKAPKQDTGSASDLDRPKLEQ